MNIYSQALKDRAYQVGKKHFFNYSEQNTRGWYYTESIIDLWGENHPCDILLDRHLWSVDSGYMKLETLPKALRKLYRNNGNWNKREYPISKAGY